MGTFPRWNPPVLVISTPLSFVFVWVAFDTRLCGRQPARKHGRGPLSNPSSRNGFDSGAGVHREPQGRAAPFPPTGHTHRLMLFLSIPCTRDAPFNWALRQLPALLWLQAPPQSLKPCFISALASTSGSFLPIPSLTFLPVSCHVERLCPIGEFRDPLPFTWLSLAPLLLPGGITHKVRHACGLVCAS